MPTKRLKVPDINDYTRFQTFLVDFFQANKTSNKNFSIRYLAGKLGWSASHLNDVLQGRRSLSLNKILQLIEFLEIKSVRAERLLLLALFESNGLAHRTEDFLAVRNSSLQVSTMTTQEKEMLVSIRSHQVLEYLMVHDGFWNFEDFKSRIRKGEDVQKSELDAILKVFEKGKIIRWNIGKTRYLIDKTEFYRDLEYRADDLYPQLQRAYSKNYQNFLDDVFAPWNDLFGMVQIPTSQLSEVYEHMAALRNYLYSLRSKALEKNPNEKFEVFQFSINLFSIFRREPKSSNRR